MKVVLLNSGGKDALACAVLLKSGAVRIPDELEDGTPIELHSLYVDAGWRNAPRAMAAAKRIAEEYCASHSTVSLSGDFQRAPGTGAHGYAGVYHQTILLSVLGGMHAVKNGISVVVMGTVKGPVTPQFPAALRELYVQGQAWHGPEMRPVHLFPLFDIGRDVVIEALKNNPILPLTATCNDVLPCGTCSKCRNRVNLLNSCGFPTHTPIPIESVTP